MFPNIARWPLNSVKKVEAPGEYEIRRENMKVWGLHNAKKKEMKKNENSLSEACGEVVNVGPTGGVPGRN
jgi:hypothetical protein